EVVALILGVGVELKRHPDIGGGAKLPEVKTGPDDTDHHIGIAAQRDGFADDLRVARKAPLPAILAENGHFLAVRQVLLLCECAPPHNRRAEKAEIVGAHLRGMKLFRSEEHTSE